MVAQQFGSSGEPIFVPDSLRVYRSFIAQQQGVDGDASLIAVAWNKEVYDPTVRTYVAHCATTTRYPNGPHDIPRVHAEAALEGKDRCPMPDCTCGFYAYYEQSMHILKSETFACSIPLHAVVQVSGRVLMGTRGVRAEKMRIEAIALNAEDAYRSSLLPYSMRNYITSQLMTEDVRAELRKTILEEKRAFDWDNADTVYGDKYHAVWTEARALTILQSISLVYGVIAYPTVAAMWEACPKPDIDHLISKRGKS